jgi:hypothetical protein
VKVPFAVLLVCASAASVQTSAAQEGSRLPRRPAPAAAVPRPSEASAPGCVYAGLAYTKFSAICIGRGLLIVCGPPSKSDPTGSWYFDDSDRKTGCDPRP